MQFMWVKGEGSTKRERGGTTVEYALLVALLCIVAIGGVRVVGASIDSALSNGCQPLLGSGGVGPLSSGGVPAPRRM